MPKKKVTLNDGTDILLIKYRQSRNLKLTISATGQIRVAMPKWIPFRAGLVFAQNNSDWITSHRADFKSNYLIEGSKIGRNFRLKFINDSNTRPPAKGKFIGNSVVVTTPLEIKDNRVQLFAKKYCEIALKKDAENYLVPRAEHLANTHDLEYSNLRLRKLISRWGSCSQNKTISLSIYLVQLPDHLIDYVIMHELAHIKHLNHSPAFWQYLQELVPDTKEYRIQLRKYKPQLTPA